MEVKLKELLTTINSRFSGPESCRLSDMLTGKLDFDGDEVKSYLSTLKDYGGSYGNYNQQNDRKDAQLYLNQFTEYIDRSNKKRN